MKMIFYSYANIETHSQKKGFALRLGLNVRV